jgi:F0F1-type ATP synthase assembly protein I
MRLDRQAIRAMQAVSGLGCSVALCLGASILAGSWADRQLHTRPALLLIGILVGLLGSAAIIYSLASSLNRTEDGDDKRTRPDDSA